MPDFFQLLTNWKKEIGFLVLLSTITATAIVFILPAKYLAITTALPANAAAADKSTVFNNSVQEFYSSMGSPDDVDRIVGTGQLDTIFLAIAEEFKLVKHYKVNEAERSALLKAATVLKKNSKVSKSEYGELQVRVWDRDKMLAPQLANALIEKLGSIHQNLQSESNKAIILSLQKSRNNLLESIDQLSTKLPGENSAFHQSRIADEIAIKKESIHQYDKLIGEYQLMVETNPAALMIVDKARPANSPDKPRRLLLIITVFILSFLFSLLIALHLERRKLK